MKETQQQQTLLDEEATLIVSDAEKTLVTPRFDDEETMVARPVVPLDADAPAVPAPELRPAQDYRSPYAPRRTWMLGLVLVSVLIGGVLGGAGLYLYQRQSHAPAVSPSATTQPETSADAVPAPTAHDQPQQAAPNTEPPSQPNEPPADAALNAEETAAPVAREPENVPATERRTAPAEGTPKRGKKGERDEESERRAKPRADDNVTRADQPQARRVDSIFYRPRRADRRRRGGDVDRVRRIFEGEQQ